MNEINSNFNLYNNFALVENMNNQGKLTNEEYLKCMLTLEQENKNRCSYSMEIKDYSYKIQALLYEISNKFIEAKGLHEEFKNFYQDNINIISNDYNMYLLSVINYGDYLRSQGESLSKDDLNLYIDAKNHLNALSF